MTKEMFCSNNEQVESLYVLAEIILNRTENINQSDLFQVPYFKYFLVFANGLWVCTEGLFCFCFCFLQVEYFLLQDDMREEKNV